MSQRKTILSFCSLPIQSVRAITSRKLVSLKSLPQQASSVQFSLAVLVALLPAALFWFKLNGGGRTCGMLLGRKPSPRSLSLTDPRNRLGLQYVCSQKRNLKKRILIFKETGEPGLHQNPSPVDLQPPKQQHLQKARAWSVCACVGPTRGYPPRRQPGSCREQNPLCPSSDRKRR